MPALLETKLLENRTTHWSAHACSGRFKHKVTQAHSQIALLKGQITSKPKLDVLPLVYFLHYIITLVTVFLRYCSLNSCVFYFLCFWIRLSGWYYLFYFVSCVTPHLSVLLPPVIICLCLVNLPFLVLPSIFVVPGVPSSCPFSWCSLHFWIFGCMFWTDTRCLNPFLL